MSKQPDIAATIKLLEEATQAEPSAILPGSVMMGMDGWDSMGMVMFISLVLEVHGFELSIADIRDCETPEQLNLQIGQHLNRIR